MRAGIRIALASMMAAGLASSAGAAPFTFSTNGPDGLMATASRPDVPAGAEIESADDFLLASPTRITGATFTGLLPSSTSAISQVVVEIYRVFPADSGPFDNTVPTRVNSPSDVAFDSRDSTGAGLTFSTAVLANNFMAANSVLNGINRSLTPRTGGEGPVSGAEVRFDVTFSTPFDLPADHYFFVPQVQLADGNFFWLSAQKPIVAPGTPFLPDLQAWIRNSALDPDWLRVGTDIVGTTTNTAAPAFNAAFSLSGETVPEPSAVVLFSAGALVLAGSRSIRRARSGRGARP